MSKTRILQPPPEGFRSWWQSDLPFRFYTFMVPAFVIVLVLVAFSGGWAVFGQAIFAFMAVWHSALLNKIYNEKTALPKDA